MNIRTAAILGIIFFSMSFLLWYAGLGDFVSLTSLQVHMSSFEKSVHAHYGWSVIIFIALYSFFLMCALPVMPPFSIVGGYLFSFQYGICYSLVSCLIGTSCSFLLLRTVMRETIAVRYREKFSGLISAMPKANVAFYLLSMQFMTIIPFSIITAVAALANVSFITFFWTTAVGSVPILCIYTFAGRQIKHIHSASDIFSPSIILILMVLMIVALMPPLYKRFKRIN